MRLPWLVAACLLGGCALQRDDAVRFTAPVDGARVQLPVLLRWTIDGHAPRAYAVFVDAAPMRPGQGLAALSRSDKICQRSPGCPDRTWLNDHGVFLTRRPALELRGVPPRGREAPGGTRHEITVVLLDGHGRRIGEQAWQRSFVTEAGP